MDKTCSGLIRNSTPKQYRESLRTTTRKISCFSSTNRRSGTSKYKLLFWISMDAWTRPVLRISSWLTSTMTTKSTCSLVALGRTYSTWTAHSRSVFSRRTEYHLVASTLNLPVSECYDTAWIVFHIKSINLMLHINSQPHCNSFRPYTH